jgi:hypothetical protein
MDKMMTLELMITLSPKALPPPPTTFVKSLKNQKFKISFIEP